MEPDPQRNVGRSKPASKSDFVPAARELVSTPVVTRSDDVCRSSWSLGHEYGKAEVPL